MKYTKKIMVLGLAATLAWGALSTRAAANALVLDCNASTQFGIIGFTLNPQFIIAIVNKVKDDPNGFTSLPADTQSLNSVVQLTVNNISGQPKTLEFGVKVSDQSVGQILNTADQSDFIISKATLPVGVSTVSYGSVQLKNSNAVAVNQQFIDEVKNNFKDPSQLSQAVQTLGTHVFTITIQLYDSSSDTALAPCGSFVTTYSTNFTLFSQPSGNTSNVPTLVTPVMGGQVFTTLPNFVWLAASSTSVATSNIRYRVEVASTGEDVIRIGVPNGELHYQWQASDPALTVGSSYSWRAIGLDSTGNPIGGTNDQGWTISNNFTIQNLTGAAGVVTLADVDAAVQKALVGSPDLLKLLGTMKISAVMDPSSLSNDIYSQLKSGQATVTSASVSTH